MCTSHPFNRKTSIASPLGPMTSCQPWTSYHLHSCRCELPSVEWIPVQSEDHCYLHSSRAITLAVNTYAMANWWYRAQCLQLNSTVAYNSPPTVGTACSGTVRQSGREDVLVRFQLDSFVPCTKHEIVFSNRVQPSSFGRQPTTVTLA